jgi:hypothetical protein
MDAFQAELNKYKFKDSTLNVVVLDTDAVSKYKSRLENLFEACFNKISDHIKLISGEKDILKFFSLRKDEFKEIWKKQTEIGKLYAFDEPHGRGGKPAASRPALLMIGLPFSMA